MVSTPEHLIAFIGIAAAFAWSPGPSNLFAVGVSVRHGPRAAAVAIAGDQSAAVVYMAIAVTGLGAVAIAQAGIIDVLRWIGVAYLTITGILMWIRRPAPGARSPTHGPRAGRLFPQGFLVAASNPKSIAFFGALFPLFIDFSAPLLPQFLVLATVQVLVDATTMLLLATLAHRAFDGITTIHSSPWPRRVAGAALVAAAGALASMDAPQHAPRAGDETSHHAGLRRHTRHIWMPLMLWLGIRAPDKHVLEHPTRARIHDAITADPGIHYSALQRELGLPRGTFSHHLRVLVQAGIVRRVGSAGRVHLLLAGPACDIDAVTLTRAQRRLLEIIDARPRSAQQTLAEHIGWTRHRVAYHANTLERRHFISASHNGRTVRYETTIEGANALREIQANHGATPRHVAAQTRPPATTAWRPSTAPI